MKCLNIFEKMSIYIAGVVLGFTFWTFVVLFRKQTIGILSKLQEIDLTTTNIGVIMIIIIIVLVSLKVTHSVLDPYPLNCSNPMDITITGIVLGGALAFLLLEPLGFLGLGLILIIVRAVLTIIIVSALLSNLNGLSNEYNPPIRHREEK